MMQTIEPGMSSPQLHPPSKTKIPTVLIQELIAILKFQVGGRGEEKRRKIKVLLFKQNEILKTLTTRKTSH